MSHMPAQPSHQLTSANPLVNARLDAGLTQTELAHRLKVSRSVVKWAEAGTYNNIPSCYHNEFPNLVNEVGNYQTFRTSIRRLNFPNLEGCVVHSVPEFLEQQQLLPNTFAMKACIPHSEVFRAITQGKCSTALREFFLTVGVDYEGN